MEKSIEGKLAVVEWADAHSPGDTADVDPANLGSIHAPYVIRTVGWILRSDAVGVTVGSEQCLLSDGTGLTYRTVTFVPAGMIRDVLPLPAQKRRRQPPTPEPRS